MIESSEPVVHSPPSSPSPVPCPQKKGRGRPRKYPPGKKLNLSFIKKNNNNKCYYLYCTKTVRNFLSIIYFPPNFANRSFRTWFLQLIFSAPPPLVKRPRGRPRLNPVGEFDKIY